MPSDLASTNGDPQGHANIVSDTGSSGECGSGGALSVFEAGSIAGMGETSIMSARIDTSVNELLGFIARQAASCKRVVG